jgi:hypothetical protein
LKTKKCLRCGKIKKIEDFYISNPVKKIYNSFCKVCHLSYAKAYYQKNKKKYCTHNREKRQQYKKEMNEYKKTLKCHKCGDARWYVLDFHHRDGDTKESVISDMKNKRPLKLIMEEILKCEVLCSNCHREHHYKESLDKE